MLKKMTMLLLGALFLFSSCVDNRYDLNKEISTDVKIPGNKVSLPFGSLKAVKLDSLIDVEEIDVLEKDSNGVYSISMSDTISPFEENIDPVTISIEPLNETAKIKFTNADVTEVHINGVHSEPATFNVPVVSFEELNKELPVLKSDVDRNVANADLDAALELIKNLGKDFPATDIEINETLRIEKESIPCDFEYVLPSQVQTIESIKLASRGNVANTSKGTLVEAVITHPKALTGVDKTISFEIVFPENFVLSKYSDEYILSNNNSTIAVKDMKADGDATTVRFYIDYIVDVDKYIDNGVIRFDDDITYTLDYTVNGTVRVDGNIKREDFVFNVAIDVPLAFSDLKGRTKDIEVDFSTVELDFVGHFDNLEYIDTINYIKFKKNENFIEFLTTIDTGWLEEMSIKDGYALKVVFDDKLIINDADSQYEGKGTKVVYSSEEHAYYIYDLNVLAAADWKIAIDRLDVNKEVKDDMCDIDVQVEIYIVNKDKEKVDKLVVNGVEMESLASTLKNIQGERKAEFEMLGADLGVEDASVHTRVIYSDLKTKTDFNISEEIPEEIARIDSIGFDKEVVLNFEARVDGLKELDTDIHFDVKIAVPSFLKLKPGYDNPADVTINVENDSIHLVADFHPKNDENIRLQLLCTGLDFTGPEYDNKGYLPEKENDGKSYIKFNDSINVVGDASIDAMEFHSMVLENNNEIIFNVDFVLSDIEVKTFHGLYDGEIDEINETVDLDLGEEFDFLRDESSSIKLSEPQIEFVIENSVGVPVKVDMLLVGRDANGVAIQSSEVRASVDILPAKYENGAVVPQSTKLFLTNDTTRLSKAGYTNVEIPNLATLLEKFPNSIELSIKPVIDQSVAHHIDISQPITFGGNYAVTVPLKFDNFKVCYSDTINDISASLGEAVDMFSNISLKARMNVVNTIPLGLSLTLEALDEDGEPIDDITIDPLMIKAGPGCDIDAADDPELVQEIALVIESKSGDVSALDKLRFFIEAATDHVAGSEGLKGNQGVKISDIVFEISGDLETEF